MINAYARRRDGDAFSDKGLTCSLWKAKGEGDRSVCPVHTGGRRACMDGTFGADCRAGPTVWGDDPHPAVTGARVGRVGPAGAHGARHPGAGGAHTHASRSGRRRAAFDRPGSTDGCDSHTQGAGDRSQRRRAILARRGRSARDPGTDARGIGRSQHDAVRSLQQVTRAGIARTWLTTQFTRARWTGDRRCCEFLPSRV